jgi:hypothetical protein
VEKKTLRAAIIISALLFLAVAGTQFINLGKSNPFAWIPTTVHPQITIVSPEENSLYALNALTIAFNVSINFERGWSYLSYVSYKASWKQDEIAVFDCETNGYVSELSYKLNLTGIHEGTHTVLISAGGHGGYRNDGYGLLLFRDAYNSTSISFTIHSVFISSPQNKTYDTSDVLLFFEVHHSFKTIAYSLDGQDKVAVSGGTWLVDLPDGGHNVTVYVMDKAGNILPSETIYFSVDTPESFPATIIMAPIGSAAFVGAGLLLYFKKRRRGRL